MAAEEVDIITRLIGARQVTAGLAGEAAAMEELETRTTRLGFAMDRTAKRSFLMNQALFTMRRFMYMGTLAVTAFAGAALKWGYDFNSQMQQGRIALGQFMGSTAAANKELRILFNFTAYTPFQFKDVVSAASMLMRFNINATTTNRILRNVTDALAGTTKATPAGLNRISVALGHMMSVGHVTGQTLLQLARDGIPGVYEATQKYFHLSSKQMQHVGSLGLPANLELEAINQYIEGSKLHGLAKRLATGSLHGRFTTFKDFLSQIMGDVEQKPFKGAQNLLGNINPILQNMDKAFNKGGFTAMMNAMGNSGTAKGIRLIVNDLILLWHVFQTGVLPVLIQFWHVLQPIAAVLVLINYGLKFLAQHSEMVRLLTGFLIINFIRLRVVAMLFAAAERSSAMMTFAFETRQAWINTAQLLFYFGKVAVVRTYAAIIRLVGQETEFTVIWNLRMIQSMIAIRLILIRVALAQFLLGMRMAWTAIRMGEFTIAAQLARTAIWEMAVALYTQLIPAFIREGIVAGIAWAATLAPITIIAIAIGGLIVSIVLLIKYWRQLNNELSKTRHPFGNSKLGSVGNFLAHSVVRGFFGAATGGASGLLPGMAGGGITDTAGWSWVGERGPELRYMPKGAVVSPLSSMPSHFPMESWRQSMDNRPVVAQLIVDGKKMAEVVAKHKQDVRNRT